MRTVSLLTSLVLLFGCPTPTSSDKSEDTGDTDTDDTDDTDDTGVAEGDTEGPALPACTPAAGDADRIALSGVVLTPSGPVAGAVVYKPSTGLIECAGDCDTAGATLVCTEGVISPGLIDPHNHLQYNSLPPWQVGPEFDSRYDWQSDDRYWEYREAYDEMSDAYECEIMKWAEAREIVHGTTSVVGSAGDGCIARGARNLDEDEENSHLEDHYLKYSSSKVKDAVEEGDGDYYAGQLASGATDAVFHHVAEGKDGSVQDEVDHMLDEGMTGPGQVYVHATDASTEQLAVMGITATGIVWSPRSNLVLYATTTPIEIANNLGVPWAIGSDWTPSGSVGQPQELACAETWLEGKGAPLNDVELWEKVTVDAAALSGLDGVLGVLTAGAAADIAVFDWASAPYRAIIGAAEPSVRLVIVDGEAVYGRTELVAELAPNPDWCDTLDACGESRSYCLRSEESGEDSETLAAVESTLEAVLAGYEMPAGYEYAGELFGLFTCADERDVCDLREPTAGDDDGDGVADTSDLCAGIYDPNQWDTDGDGLGDSCDICPTVPGEVCGDLGTDYDGDGIENDEDNCPNDSNEDQADVDGDGTGDSCDACPEEANPAGSGCLATIPDVRTGVWPEGATLRFEDVVVTGVRTGEGFFVQDPNAAQYAGLYVYDLGDNVVEVGDVLSLEGTYEEYYELSEITSPSAVVTASGAEVAPTEFGSACDVVAAGLELYESMLLSLPGGTVTNANPDAADGDTEPDYDEFLVDDCLRVDDFLYQELDQPAEGTVYTAINGILLFSFDNFKLAPRNAGDLEAL